MPSPGHDNTIRITDDNMIQGLLSNKPNYLNRRKTAHSMTKLLLQKLEPFTFVKSFVLWFAIKSLWSYVFCIVYGLFMLPTSKKDKQIYLTGFTAQNSNTCCSIWVFFLSLKKTSMAIFSKIFFSWLPLLQYCIKTHARHVCLHGISCYTPGDVVI
jgi:hypothetical protein